MTTEKFTLATHGEWYQSIKDAIRQQGIKKTFAQLDSRGVEAYWQLLNETVTNEAPDEVETYRDGEKKSNGCFI